MWHKCGDCKRWLAVAEEREFDTMFLCRACRRIYIVGREDVQALQDEDLDDYTEVGVREMFD